MIIKKFRITNYRNIVDSGWLDINKVAAFVGPNGAGKSNILQALYKLNPLDKEIKYMPSLDYTLWEMVGFKMSFDDAIACSVMFELEQQDINELQSTLKDRHTKKNESQDEDESNEPYQDPDLSDVLFSVSKTYGNKVIIEVTQGLVSFNEIDFVKKWLEKNLPHMVYIFGDTVIQGYANLDQVAANTNSDLEVLNIVLSMLGVTIQELKEMGSTDEGRLYRNRILSVLSENFTDVFQKLWNQEKLEFSLEVDADTLILNVFDEQLGRMKISLSERSTGVKWYVGFAWKYLHALHEGKKYVLLMDEAGTHLHPQAQRDLLSLFEKLSTDNDQNDVDKQRCQVLYSTHEPSMVDCKYPERIFLVDKPKKPKTGIRINHGTFNNIKEATEVIEQRLGLGNGMSMIIEDRPTLIVEGGDDVMVYEKLRGLIGVLKPNIYLWPTGGAGNIPLYASYACARKMNVCVLVDSDGAGREAKNKIKDQYIVGTTDELPLNVLETNKMFSKDEREKKQSAMEELFPTDFIVQVAANAFKSNMTLDDIEEFEKNCDIKEAQDELICTRIRRYMKQQIPNNNWDKNIFWKELLKHLDKFQTKKDLDETTVTKATRLFKSINRKFESEIESENGDDNKKED